MASFLNISIALVLIPIFLSICVTFVGNFFNDGSSSYISEDWQQVAGVPEKLFVYSAHYEYYEGLARIRVIGATRPFSTRKVYCQFYDIERVLTATRPALIQTSKHPSRELPYSPVFIFCPLFDLTNVPHYISITPKRNSPFASLTNLVQVSYSSEADAGFEFGACVQPTYNYESPLQLLQWIEYQLLMGVEHFTFYNMSIGPKTSCLINSYGPKRVKVLPWSIHHLPELHNNGQVVQVNDCVFRYRGLSKYLVMLDFDEYIVPNVSVATDYSQLIRVCHSHSRKLRLSQPVQFQFRSALFGLGFPEFNDSAETKGNSKNEIGLEQINLHKNVIRLKHIKPFDYRSKFITRPDLVIEPGIHSLVDAIPRGSVEVHIPLEVGYVHHYRRCNWAADCSGKEWSEDKSGHPFAAKLLQRVKAKLKSVEKECGLSLADFK